MATRKPATGRTARTPKKARASAAKARKPASAKRTAAARTRRRTGKRDWAPAFLEAFERSGMVTQACREAEVGRRTVYDRREADAAFAAGWAEAEDRAVEILEAAAYSRAVRGVQRDVFHQGAVVGTERRYSDTLLIFLLKARRPQVYRENVKVEHSGAGGGPIAHEFDLSALSDEDLDALERLTDRATKPR